MSRRLGLKYFSASWVARRTLFAAATLFISTPPGKHLPCRAVSRYLANRPTSRPNAAFLGQSGEALTRRQFTDSLQKCLIAAGVPTAERYTAPSFRIGATTAAALNGVPEGLNQA